MDLSSGELWAALGTIVVVNILLSGDNAVVIAMAARSLPPAQRNKAMIWGTAGAIGLRIVLTILAVRLLDLPYLRLIGGALLLWIGIQLLEQKGDDDEIEAHGTMSAAIRTILIADLVMSIDNVVAVAGAAAKAPEQYKLQLLIVGIGISIPIIIAGSAILLKIMERFPVIVSLGAALLGYLAGEMFVSDPAVAKWFETTLPHAEYIVGAVCAAIVVVVGHWWHRRDRSSREAAA